MTRGFPRHKGAPRPPRVRWYVWGGGIRQPHTANMRGTWGWDAVCPCGHDTNTGGATRGSVERLMTDHHMTDCPLVEWEPADQG